MKEGTTHDPYNELAEELGKLGPGDQGAVAEILEALNALLEDSHVSAGALLARQAAYAALGRIGSPEAVTALENLLTKPLSRLDYEMVMTARLKCCSRPEAQAICSKRLSALLDQPNAPPCRIVFLLEQLANNYDPKRIALIQRALYAAQDKDVRVAALYSLAKWLSSSGDARDDVRRIALESLSDPEPSVRERAALGLGRCGDVRTVRNLSPLLDDPAPSVRDAALRAICRLLNWEPPQIGSADNKMLPLDGFKKRLEPVLSELEDLELRIIAGTH